MSCDECKLVARGLLPLTKKVIEVKTFDLFCPHCNMQVETKVIAIGNSNGSAASYDLLEDVFEYRGDSLIVTLCSRCESPFLLKQMRYSIDPDMSDTTKEVVLYPIESKLSLESIPDSIERHYTDARKSFNASIYSASALLCRLSLEALCAEYDVIEGHLYPKLLQLEKKGIIESRMINWAHGIRLLGNDAAHNPQAIISKEDAKDVLDFTEAILLYTFVLNTKFDAFSNRRKKA